MYVRTIDAGVFDEGGWSFDALGPEQPYEEPERYRRRLIRDRFTREMLPRYLEALGITSRGSRLVHGRGSRPRVTLALTPRTESWFGGDAPRRCEPVRDLRPNLPF